MYYKEFKIKDKRLARESVLAKVDINDDGIIVVIIEADFKNDYKELEVNEPQLVQAYVETISFTGTIEAEWFLSNLTTESVTELLSKQTNY